jgi:hypothetical protein
MGVCVLSRGAWVVKDGVGGIYILHFAVEE